MKPGHITKGSSYTNKSGRSERHVLDVGHHVTVRWLGAVGNEPQDEPGVRFIDTRMGNTYYGRSSGKLERTMYLSAFASWASTEVPDALATPHN